ncbi:hypothetical protein F1737_04625 [Methanoplanus sp. FWC-SCC4]|uniref:Uncharacterized protein n=1 Tax=Methanochimaera problematica TaxID=2609417 RepID=A0AA97FD54_9EURY|nr:hypothetical protein [Methanoplanus sp. FWC-SCC4]WOF16039.1 hypothetical protein F1737_04625 [Methanoplanus sp. FWC-SCC4]
MQALGDERCIVNEQNLKTTVDFIFDDKDRATEFIQNTDPAVVIGIFQSMKETNEYKQNMMQNNQPGNNEIGDNEIVTEAVQIEDSRRSRTTKLVSD